jgi:hypothetical protein
MKSYCTVFLLLLLLSCKKDPESIGPCGTTTPLKDIPFLVKKIELLSGPRDSGYAIFTCIYKKSRVFWIYDLNTSSPLEYYDCEGNRYDLDLTLYGNDPETREFIRIRSIKDSCPYKIWSTPNYDKFLNCP